MKEKTSAAGWVVELTIAGTPVTASQAHAIAPASPSYQFFNVAIGSPDKAIEAARKKAHATADAPMRVIRQLSPAEVHSIKLRAGDAKPA